MRASYRNSPRKIIVLYYNSACPDAFNDIGIFSMPLALQYPDDPCDRYRELNFPALLFETAKPQ
jgi:hypothetical protein